MNTTSNDLGRTIALPSYIFITLLLFFLMGFGIRSLWQAGEIGLALLAVVLVIIHVSLYWTNFFGIYNNSKRWYFYYPMQTALMLGLSLLQHTNIQMGLSFLFSATICIVGEALGLWGNSRRSLFLGIFYFGVLFTLLFLLTDRAAFYGLLSGMLINGGAIIFLIAMVVQQMSERQKVMELAESLESANAKLAASAAKIESLTLQNERQRMARELHDTLAQGVAGLVLQLEAVKAHLSAQRGERASAIVEQALGRARSTLAESRAAIDDLRVASSNAADSIREHGERFQQATGIPCETEIMVGENQLSTETTSHAMNILNEALTNVARHAQATQVHVKWAVQGQTLELEVRDNGKGFDVKQPVSGHYGLLGMYERARLTDGQLMVESNKKGTSIRFLVGRA
ncbi:MAG: sensor histidine kinase [Anaerolineales bacterium]